MKTYFLLFFALFYFAGFGQEDKETHYLNQFKQPITKQIFDQKCKTYVYKCQKYEIDTLRLFKINNRYKFGKLDKEEFQQIRKLLIVDSKTKIEENKSIIVIYYDTLIDYTRALKNRKAHFRDYHKNDNVKDKGLSEKKFYENRNKYVKNKFKCIKKFQKKYNTKISYVFKYGEKEKSSYGNLNMVKDRGVIKHLFFKNMNESYMLILKPNGNYLIVGGHLSDRNLGKLLKKEDWKSFKEQLNISQTNKTVNGYGIFKKSTPGYHKKHCF